MKSTVNLLICVIPFSILDPIDFTGVKHKIRLTQFQMKLGITSLLVKDLLFPPNNLQFLYVFSPLIQLLFLNQPTIVPNSGIKFLKLEPNQQNGHASNYKNSTSNCTIWGRIKHLPDWSEPNASRVYFIWIFGGCLALLSSDKSLKYKLGKADLDPCGALKKDSIFFCISRWILNVISRLQIDD